MFHAYVLAKGARVTDAGRAEYLMDRELLAQSFAAMADERDNDPRHDAIYDAQWVWDYYCERHVEKYGEYFQPDVDRNWGG